MDPGNATGNPAPPVMMRGGPGPFFHHFGGLKVTNTEPTRSAITTIRGEAAILGGCQGCSRRGEVNEIRAMRTVFRLCDFCLTAAIWGARSQGFKMIGGVS